MKKFFLSAVFLTFTSTAVFAAPPKRINEDNESISAALSFSNLPNTQNDSNFNKQVFTQQALESLERASISLETTKRGTRHISFHASYAYIPNDGEYRFVSYDLSVENKNQHSVCKYNTSSWWNGPSGPNFIVNNSQSVLNAFIKKCIRS